MTTKANVWRRPVSNIARKSNSCLRTVIRRGAAGWQWLLLCGDEVVKRGVESNKAKCYDALREAKR
jgi:hypothetical protein